MPHLTTIVTRPVSPTASPTVPSAATASSLGAISGKMSHLTTIIASSTATATTLVTIFGKMPSLTAIITSSATTIASAAPSPPTTVPPSPGSAATATSKPFSPTVAAAAAAPLDVGSVGTGDVDGLDAAVVALGDHELDDLPLSQGTVSFSLDGGLVDEEVLPAVVRRDETEPLGVVEPLHRSPRSVVRLLHRSGGSQPRDHRGNLNPHAKREKKRNPLPVSPMLVEASLSAC
ncbi:unnamed protein product [Musa hybrid cultivar]